MIATVYLSASSGTLRATPGPGKNILAGLYGENFFEFCFLEWCILVHFIFLSDGGAPNVAGLEKNFPLSPCRRACVSLSVG